jgi:Na+-driven multidrug efflux pump
VFGQSEYAQIPMAVVGIVMKFFQIVISIVIGIAAGCIPIVGYNIGAGLKDRARGIFSRLLLVETCIGFAALLIVEFFPRQLLAIFGAENESVYYAEFGIKALRIYLCMMIFACINKATFIYLQSLGKALISTSLSMIREILVGVGLSLILPTFFGLNGVLYSMPVADILTFLISGITIGYVYKILLRGTNTANVQTQEAEIIPPRQDTLKPSEPKHLS